VPIGDGAEAGGGAEVEGGAVVRITGVSDPRGGGGE